MGACYATGCESRGWRASCWWRANLGGETVIKSLSLLTRKSTLSKEEFRRIWLGEHAPLVHAVPQVRKYVLSFILGEPTRPDVPTQPMSVDAVAELWYDD